jgi:hypothetical protein
LYCEEKKERPRKIAKTKKIAKMPQLLGWKKSDGKISKIDQKVFRPLIISDS